VSAKSVVIVRNASIFGPFALMTCSFLARRALEIRPNLFNVWFNLANAQLKLGKKDDAVVSLKKTLELKPDITSAR